MIQLEKVYLLNVLIYINEIDTTRKFLEINHKCKEVSEMLRIFTAKNCYDQTKYMSLKHKHPYIPKDIYHLFPTVETIECEYDDIIDENNTEIFEKVEKIRVKIEGTHSETEIKIENKSIRNKIETINLSKRRKYLLFHLDSLQYPNLKKLVISNIIKIDYVLEENENIQLDEIVIRYSKHVFDDHEQEIIEELKGMKKYKYIKRKTLMIWKTNPKVMKELEMIFDVVYFSNLNVIDCTEFYFEKSKTININEILEYLTKCYFSKIDRISKTVHMFDCRNCKTLERITIGYDLKNIIKIEGLNYLQEIECVNNINQFDVSELPSSITRLICRNFTSDQNISQIVWHYPNIKSVKIIQNSFYEEIPNVVRTFFPQKDVKLDEITFEMNSLSTDGMILHLSQFNELMNYPEIKNKSLTIIQQDYHLQYKKVVNLRRIMNVNVEIICPIDKMPTDKFRNIIETPENVDMLSILGTFDWRFIEEQRLLTQFKYIFCLCRTNRDNETVINLNGFTNCTEMNTILPFGKVIIPPNLEDLTVECHGEANTIDLTPIPKLKRLRLRNYYGIREYHFILPKHLEYLMLEGEKIIIDNLEHITIEKIEENKNPKQERFFKRMDTDK